MSSKNGSQPRTEFERLCIRLFESAVNEVMQGADIKDVAEQLVSEVKRFYITSVVKDMLKYLPEMRDFVEVDESDSDNFTVIIDESNNLVGYFIPTTLIDKLPQNSELRSLLVQFNLVAGTFKELRRIVNEHDEEGGDIDG